jgi:hypothetical protein
VNDPFRYGGVTMYQTDWALAAVTVRLVEQPNAGQAGQVLQQLQDQAEQQQAEAMGLPAPSSSSNTRLPQRAFSLPFADLEGRPGVKKGSKLYATFLPLELPPADGRPPRGISRESGPLRPYHTPVTPREQLWGQQAHPRADPAIGVLHTQSPLLKLAVGIARARTCHSAFLA